MKRLLYILLLLFSASYRALGGTPGQESFNACTGSWETYAITPDPFNPAGATHLYEWIIDKKNVLDTIVYGNGDSIKIQWGNTANIKSNIKVIQHNLYNIDGTEFRCSGSAQEADIYLKGVIISVQDAVACVGDSITFSDEVGMATSYIWNDTFSGPSFTYVTTRPDTIQISVKGTSPTGCTTTALADLVVNPLPVFDITVDGVVRDTLSCPIDLVTLDAGFVGGIYNWSTGDITPQITVEPLEHTALEERKYYSVTIMNDFGCEAQDSIAIIRCPEPIAENIPIAFTPNDDYQNEKWIIPFLTSIYKDVSVDVYDRWGNIVFTSRGVYEPWDGKYNGKTLPMGTYYYIIKVDKKSKPITGNVLIIR